MKKKKVLIAVIVIIGLVLLFPIPQRLKDGGSIRYAALLYQITDVHRINPDIESDEPYLEGIEIEILGAKVFSNITGRADGTTDTLTLKEVSELVLVKGYTQEEIEEKLKGEDRDNVIDFWGEPAGSLSGMWGDVWFLDEKEENKITLYYAGDGYVENVRIDSVSGDKKLIYGDVSVTEELGLTKDDIIIVPEVFREPPELTIVCGEKQVTALKGTYSWEYSNGNGTSTGIEADSMHPLDSKEYMNELPLAYSYKSSIDSFKAHLQFEIAPDEVEIRYWDASCWNDYSAESKELTVQALEADYVDGGFSTEYTAKLLEGNYIYEVIAKWSSSEDYGGTAYYSFYTVMGDYEPVSIQE